MTEYSAPAGSTGERLRAAREARGLGLDSVAAQLKLHPRQVEALERDAFEQLGGHTYARGFLRNYARLLELDGDALVAAAGLENEAAPNLEVTCNADGAMPQAQARRPWLLSALGLGLPIAVGLALAAYLDWFKPDSTKLPQIISSPASTDAIAPAQAAASSTVPQGAAKPSAPASAATETAKPPAPAAPAASTTQVPQVAKADAAPALPAAGEKRLEFEFATDTWLEIKDADGRTLVSQVRPGGSKFSVDGKAPLALVVGHAGSVQLRVDGQTFDLQPHTKVDVARFSVK
ncbi:MAG: helix-turn-helix domain-containing protein [Rhodocyclaceae bacterium]|nr:helix-turn-helix domain-containing protein [Rhodocyclaceae bacterium]MBX3669094.1 helix-turn-helix domain-containing protein [Rhodocyclaceae bacterium]